MPNLTATIADGYGSVSPLQSSSTKADARNSTSANFTNNSIVYVYAIHSAIFGRYYLFRPIFFF